MQRLFSYLLILTSCLYIYHHLLITFIKADDAANIARSSTSCDAATLSLRCANLGNISSPFGDVAPCAISESFRISNCSTPQAHWDGFTEALGSDDAHLGAPAVTHILQEDSLNFIDLAWNLSLLMEINQTCDALSANAVNTYIPDVINLTSFANESANGTFLLSYNNNILLLNCSSSPLPAADIVQINSPMCNSYQKACVNWSSTLCAQIVVPTKELMLKQYLERFSCSHFQFFVSANPIPPWKPGLVQMFYGDTKCVACYRSNGTCLYDRVISPPRFTGCSCGNNESSDTDCTLDHINNCEGFKCRTGAKIATWILAATVVFTVILCFAVFYYYIVSLTLARRLGSGIQYYIRHLNLDGLTERPIEYSYASIASATNSFIDVLGEGGFGAVYKGTLADDSGNLSMEIAVKVLGVGSKHNNKQFLSEVATIGRIHHFHVVRLLGFCIQENKEMLVYEYAINGSLDKWLFNNRGARNRQMLHWEQRYAIAVGIAKGLSYLHEECRHRIVHCDIKPQNILLDGQMCPKIADFGLARLMSRNESQVATWARGTPGYIAPEFWMGGEGQLSTKFDVYSYGMVLLELISGHRNFEDGGCFPETAFEAAMSGDFKSIMDVKLGIPMQRRPAVDGDTESMKYSEGCMQWQLQVRTAVFVALWCIQDHPMCRPSMSEVVKYLEGMAAINEQPPRPLAITSYTSMSSSAQQRISHHHYDVTPFSGGGR